MKIDEIMHSLSTTDEGSTSQEVQERLKEYGYNDLKEKIQRTSLEMFLEESKDVFIFSLLSPQYFRQ